MLEGLIRRTNVFDVDRDAGAPVPAVARTRAGVLAPVLVALALALVPAFVAAQPGEVKIRLERGGVLFGHGFVIRPDTVNLIPEGRADTLMLAFDSIRELRARRGDQYHFWKGAFIGAAVGAALGALALYASGDDRPDPNAILDLTYSAGTKAAIGAMAGGILGAATGGIIGGFHRTPRYVLIGPMDLQLEVRIGAGESPRAPAGP